MLAAVQHRVSAALIPAQSHLFIVSYLIEGMNRSGRSVTREVECADFSLDSEGRSTAHRSMSALSAAAAQRSFAGRNGVSEGCIPSKMP